ncbi:MAG TPA: hypothetical protein VGS60_00650, partial [Actinomycetes bacterium]|nr:hypothetical protein [Actinomycetes bacterium]
MAIPRRPPTHRRVPLLHGIGRRRRREIAGGWWQRRRIEVVQPFAFRIQGRPVGELRLRRPAAGPTNSKADAQQQQQGTGRSRESRHRQVG